jgi:hypothetical protein
MLMTHQGIFASWLLMTLLGTAPATAQGPIQVRIAPRLGMVYPGERLYEAVERSGSHALTVSAAAMEKSPSIGTALLVGSDSLGAFLHVSIDHAPSAAASLVVYGPPSALPAVVITHRSVFPATLTELGADLVLPLRLRLGPFRPFATAGFGLTRYRFTGPESGVPVPPNVVPPQSGTAEARRFGGGIDFELWSRGTSLSIVRTGGGYFGETAHRLIVTAEIWFNLRS